MNYSHLFCLSYAALKLGHFAIFTDFDRFPFHTNTSSCISFGATRELPCFNLINNANCLTRTSVFGGRPHQLPPRSAHQQWNASWTRATVWILKARKPCSNCPAFLPEMDGVRTVPWMETLQSVSLVCSWTRASRIKIQSLAVESARS